jgi:predicted glutamine amidotransferase
MAQDGSGTGALIVASEPVSAERSDWTAVPVNHIVTVDAALNVEIEPMV